MRLKKLILLAFLVGPLLSFSQSDLIKRIAYGTDTLTVIDSVAVSLINYNFVSLDECTDLKRLQKTQIDLLETSVEAKNEVIANQNNQLTAYKGVDQEQEIQIDLLEKDKQAKERQIKLLKFTRSLYTIVGFAGGGYLGYTLAKFLP
jgi:hypothetical protein